LQRNDSLIKVPLPDESLLNLTQAEFEPVPPGGDSALRNHLLRQKEIGGEIGETMEVRDA